MLVIPSPTGGYTHIGDFVVFAAALLFGYKVGSFARALYSVVTVKTKVCAAARKELLEGAWRRTEANYPVPSIFKEPIALKVEFEVIPK